MKTIIFINSLNFGSTGNIMNSLAEEARKKGFISFTAVPHKKSNKKKNNQIYIGNILLNRIESYLNRYYFLSRFLFYFSTKKFIKKLKQVNPDIIHLHNLHNSCVNLRLLFHYIEKRKIKLVWTLHDCWSFTGHCPHFDNIGCIKWKKQCYDCPLYNKYPISAYDDSKLMYNLKKNLYGDYKNMYLISPSKWLYELVGSSFLKNCNRQVIYNGIDLDTFKFTPSNFKLQNNIEDKYMLLGVASPWTEKKGIDVFCKLSQMISNRYQIVLVGINKEINKEIPKNIICIERTADKTELAKIYSAADVFINPTREETLGLVNIEALSCGTPVVTFNTGGSPETIDSSCGCVVEKNNINDLLDKIIYVCEKNIIKREHCIARAKMFDRIKMYNSYVDLYENILKM